MKSLVVYIIPGFQYIKKGLAQETDFQLIALSNRSNGSVFVHLTHRRS